MKRIITLLLIVIPFIGHAQSYIEALGAKMDTIDDKVYSLYMGLEATYEIEKQLYNNLFIRDYFTPAIDSLNHVYVSLEVNNSAYSPYKTCVRHEGNKKRWGNCAANMVRKYMSDQKEKLRLVRLDYKGRIKKYRLEKKSLNKTLDTYLKRNTNYDN